MIPRLIHQKWNTNEIPERFRAWSRTWIDRNPGWTHILWTDRMLLDFVAQHYPQMLPTYCSYSKGILRADAARYMVLHHFGGVYADLDTECLAAFEPLVGEERVLLCEEPPSHWALAVRARDLPNLIFSGVMASPAGHPFWRAVIDFLPVMKEAPDVLDATGPMLLTGIAHSYPDKSALSISSCHLFNAFDKRGREMPEYRGAKPDSLARHYWAGTWWPRPKHTPHRDRLRSRFYRARNWLTRGQQFNVQAARTAVNPAVLSGELPCGNALAILVPVTQAADYIGSFLASIRRLQFPTDRISLVFCEGDSLDGSYDLLAKETEALRDSYRSVTLLRYDLGHRIPRQERGDRRHLGSRRARLARVRNHLIDHGLKAGDDWALWIDIDVWKFPADIVSQLLAAKARIVTPNCVRWPGGPSSDLKTYRNRTNSKDWRYHRDIYRGLYTPAPDDDRRRYLSDLRYLDRVRLDAVGGTMLLVDAALHRAGLRFPELPYDHLIGTEAFGAVARDLGIPAVGLPKIEVLQVP